MPAEYSSQTIFFHALKEGFNTMDLLSSFFFSSIVILCLKKELHPTDQNDFRKMITMAVRAGCIGMSLLGLSYVGFSYLAAFNSDILTSIPKDEMLGVLALNILGPYAGVIAIVAVSLACLTTAIALAAVFAEFLHEDLTQMKVSYKGSLAITLVGTFVISILGFAEIQGFLAPILVICYPALIVLSVVNFLHKLYGFDYVKAPVYITFAITLILYFSPV